MWCGERSLLSASKSSVSSERGLGVLEYSDTMRVSSLPATASWLEETAAINLKKGQKKKGQKKYEGKWLDLPTLTCFLPTLVSSVSSRRRRLRRVRRLDWDGCGMRNVLRRSNGMVEVRMRRVNVLARYG